jgi:diguanylate cyclase (GGDEF)-like protein
MAFSYISYSRESHVEILNQADKLRTANPQQSQILLNRLDKAELDANQAALYQYLLGHNFLVNGEPDEAISILQILAFKDSISIIRFRALSTLLNAYSTTNDWPKALEIAGILQQHMDGVQELTSEINENVHLGLLHFYNRVGEYELTKQLANSLLNTTLSLRMKCLIKAELLYSFIKTSPKALQTESFEEALRVCKSLNDQLLVNAVNGYYAEYLLEINQPNEALTILLDNLPSVKAINYQALTAAFYDLLAQGYLAIKNYNDAEKYARILLETKEQHNYQPVITTAYSVLAAVSEQKRLYSEALAYHKKYTAANSNRLNENNSKLLAIQKAKLNVIEINTQIAILDKENTLLKTQVLLDKESAHNRLLILALLTMVLVVFILWAYKNRKTYLEMRYFAQNDELTGIANRHHFAQLAHSAIKLCRKTDQPVSFVIFDLDFFKRINDSYGHLVGDEALKMAVNAAKSACRRNDTIGRLGGEEFGIILPGCGNHLATHIAEKCRRAIEKVDTSASGHQFALTASFGVADSSVCSYEFTTLFAGADKALFQAKDLGRNQVYNYQAHSFAFDI